MLLGTTDVQLFTTFNALPEPVAVADGATDVAVLRYNRLYQQYRGMVESLRPKNKSALANFNSALGNQAAAWKERNTAENFSIWLKTHPEGNRQQFFDEWANFNLNNPGNAKRAYKEVANDPVNRALDDLDPSVRPQHFVVGEDGVPQPKFTPVFEVRVSA